MALSPEIVFFAVEAGIKLYGGIRKAYVDNTRDRDLILPLPRTNGINEASVRNWFANSEPGQKVAGANPRVRVLLEKTSLDDRERSEFLDLYTAFNLDCAPQPDEQSAYRGQITADEVSALLTIRQWAKDEPGQPRSALQQVAGTLVNLAVGYFAAMPNAVSQKHPQGRALLSFFQAIDTVDFANTPVTEIAGDLLVGVLDGVGAHPEVFSVGKNEQLLIGNVTRSVAGSARELLKDAPSSEREESGRWLNVIAASMIRGAAETVLANPVRFLGVKNEAQGALVSQVGTVVTELLVGEDQVTFRRLLSTRGVQSLARSVLGSVAKNPDLLKIGNAGLKRLLVSLAGDLARVEDLLSPDLFPELARLVLEKSADNLDLIWRTDENLLLAASRSVLKALSAPPPDGSTWKPALTPSQVLSIAETVLDEAIENPAWIENDVLASAMEAMLASLRTRDPAKVSASTGVAILKAGLKAAALRSTLLKKAPAKRVTALQAALDVILAAAEGNWFLGRNSVLGRVAAIALEKLAQRGADAKHVRTLKTVLKELADGKLPLDVASFGEELDRRLAAA